MLTDSVDMLKGVGEKLKNDLALMDIYTMEDLLHYFPFRYDVAEIKPLSELVHDDHVTIVGQVIHDPSITHYGRKRSRLTFNIKVEHAAVKAVMFNRTFAKKHLPQGTIVTLSGKWDAHRLQITVSNYQVGYPNTDVHIQPIYSVKGDVKPGKLKVLIKQCIDHYLDEIEEILPDTYLTAYKLPTRKDALKMIHHPSSQAQLKHARRRFIYEELLLFQLKMNLLKKHHRQLSEGRKQELDDAKVARFIKKLPFTLTGAQRNSLDEILVDMKASIQMNRLLQGDVGSGKTAVATICLYASITAGNQGAFMVPTEILAEQHYQSIVKLLGSETKIALLTSSVKGKKRQEILDGIKKNDIQIVIGTHSLIQDDVIFHQLGLIIIDEQHRFGVEQRRTLREKGLEPDVLFMTATPIPRTLAITAFGDMDISIIDQLPAGRKEIETYWVKDNMLDRVLQFIEKRIAHGEQAYIVSPLIEESEAFDYQNAIDLYHQLETYYPAHIKIGLLHGRLPNDEKEGMMQQFIQNKIHILVATTVIEVGVNVPNASVMVIYDAERFGLSQLHQLRGRVGRGDQQSYCILIADPKGEVGKERMRIMTETNDGFRLSEEDLKLRGPGDFFGKKQSGLPEFKVADLIHDYRALEVARKDAAYIISNHLLETDRAYLSLNKMLEEYTEQQRFD
ncbi:ATP-dependent DNA helicase RecG [Pseudogracilibacillus auburnensis]|uniref:ATP-dependent DNA helicase RecG n=1 Tax=Pseudogracilibacillus auburnensis TaxID=1494959 RepID=A0A2V3WIF4_9BACI|nr:ATP-dependent DNA helicase RecG [Pseudogracilibacillus auburnensis]PXW88569.1 ATP-dependent DNA helicase RecG [Pseudogracilibacillus auburnensis]